MVRYKKLIGLLVLPMILSGCSGGTYTLSQEATELLDANKVLGRTNIKIDYDTSKLDNFIQLYEGLSQLSGDVEGSVEITSIKSIVDLFRTLSFDYKLNREQRRAEVIIYLNSTEETSSATVSIIEDKAYIHSDELLKIVEETPFILYMISSSELNESGIEITENLLKNKIGTSKYIELDYTFEEFQKIVNIKLNGYASLQFTEEELASVQFENNLDYKTTLDILLEKVDYENNYPEIKESFKDIGETLEMSEVQIKGEIENNSLIVSTTLDFNYDYSTFGIGSLLMEGIVDFQLEDSGSVRQAKLFENLNFKEIDTTNVVNLYDILN